MMNFSSKLKIRLDTQTEVANFVAKANNCQNDIELYITDDDNLMCINARSLMGCMYAREFTNMWLISNSDKIHTFFNSFAAE